MVLHMIHMIVLYILETSQSHVFFLQMAANGINGFRATNGQNGMNNNDQNGFKTRTKLGALGPDGYPRLPPINKPSTQKTDPYANSKLMTYRLANHKQALLMHIM